MAVVQDRYARTAEPLVQGQIHNTQTCDVDTMVQSGDTAIPFGRAVSRNNASGAGAQDCVIGAFSGRTRGITVMDERLPAGDGVAFVKGERVPVLWRGDVAVRVETPVTAGANVYADREGKLSSQANNGVDAVTVTAGGTGYTSAPTVAFSGGGGSGAAATAVIEGGSVTAVVITAPGSGYTSNPTVAFTGGSGSGATATAARQLNAIEITDASFLRAAASGGLSVVRISGLVQSA